MIPKTATPEYVVTFESENPKDEEKWGRTLVFKNYDLAQNAFTSLVVAALKEWIIDGYKIRLQYSDGNFIELKKS